MYSSTICSNTTFSYILSSVKIEVFVQLFQVFNSFLVEVGGKREVPQTQKMVVPWIQR